MDKPIFLDGDNVYLRPIDMDDLETFYNWFNNPELRQYLYLSTPITKVEEKEILERMIKDKDSVVLSIIIKKTEKLIGNIGLHRINRVHRSAMLGIAVGDLEEVSKGYGTEAMRLILDYGFKTLNLHRIDLWVHEFNTRAIKAYNKLGFVEEGRKRKSFYWNGKYHDEFLMSILKSEWMDRKENTPR